MTHAVIADMRRDVQLMKDLASAGHLTPDRWRTLTARLTERIDAAERLIDGAPEETFELTNAGRVTVLGLRGQPVEKFVRHLAVIDGDRP